MKLRYQLRIHDDACEFSVTGRHKKKEWKKNRLRASVQRGLKKYGHKEPKRAYFNHPSASETRSCVEYRTQINDAVVSAGQRGQISQCQPSPPPPCTVQLQSMLRSNWADALGAVSPVRSSREIVEGCEDTTFCFRRVLVRHRTTENGAGGDEGGGHRSVAPNPLNPTIGNKRANNAFY